MRPSVCFVLSGALLLGCADGPSVDQQGDAPSSPSEPHAGRLAEELASMARPLRLTALGYRPEARRANHQTRALGEPLTFQLGPSDDAPIVLGAAGHEVRATRRSACQRAYSDLTGALSADDVTCQVGNVVLATTMGLEDLFVLRQPGAPLGYDLTLPAGWHAQLAAGNVAELVDQDGTPQLRISADRAWDRHGAPIRVTLSVDSQGLRVEADASAELPLLIDPTWMPASVPVKLRRRHTTTLLGDGTLLLAGGEVGAAGDRTIERYDPIQHANAVLGEMVTARSEHTATLLEDGRVLFAGGLGPAALATTELFDPATETLAPGPAMNAPRARHTATRLNDGRVLLLAVDGSGADLFDPVADTMTAAPLPIAGINSPAAALLEDGRVLIVSAKDLSDDSLAQIFDPTAMTYLEVAPPIGLQAGGHSLTRLRDGRALLHGGCPCSSVGGPTFFNDTAWLFDPAAGGGVGGFVQTTDPQRARSGHTASLLPDGRVLFAGTEDFTGTNRLSAEIFDPTSEGWTLLGDLMSDPRGAHTATVLPSGDVLILGGGQASAELFAATGHADFGAPATSLQMLVGRQGHTGTLLRDGRVLLSGGELLGPGLTPDAEIFSPTTNSFAAAAPMVSLRREHSATLLDDGRVLLAGGVTSAGATASAEVFDPSGGAMGSFVAVGSMSAVRTDHTSLRLPDGRILMVGGTSSSDTVEVFDPRTNTFSDATGSLPAATGSYGTTLLPDGQVLISGHGTSHLFDPWTTTVTPSAAPGASRADARANTLPDGRALIVGGAIASGELFDITTGQYAFSEAPVAARSDAITVMLPSGQLLWVGGEVPGAIIRQFISPGIEFFDWRTEGGGKFETTPSSFVGIDHSATLLTNGTLLVTGGPDCIGLCPSQPRQEALLLRPAGQGSSYAPLLLSAPSSVQAGQELAITGQRLTGPSASGGRANDSSSAVPLFSWQPFDGSAVVFGRTARFDDSSASWIPNSTAHAGPGLLRVSVNGVTSDALVVVLEPAALATSCSYDAQCASGNCETGVCCDQACDGACQACTAAKKGSGVDGECGVVPPGQDPNDGCFLTPGSSCATPDDCDSGFCVDGVCCLSACTGQCEACDVVGSVGTCVPVNGAPHGDRLACDGSPPTDLCDTKLCDGMTRGSCEATVGPCDPYACGLEACLSVCETDTQCAAGYHCESGACVAGQCMGSLATNPAGQTIDCAPYTCQADGSCRTSCATVQDCAAPFACNFDGRCVARPAPDLAAGCDCSSAPGSSGGSGHGPMGLGLLAMALGMVRLVRRRRSALALGVAASFALPMGLARADSADDEADKSAPPKLASDEDRKAQAKARFEKGIGFVSQQAWAPALAEFAESRQLHPTRAATQNAAYCLRQLGRLDESLDAYEQLLREFAEMDERSKREAQSAITEMRGQLGVIEIDGAEPGATIVIDGRQRGAYPPASALRVAAGSHIVRVFKKGYEPFEARVDVASRGTSRVAAPLVALTSSGTIKVREAGGAKLRVLIDGIEVGETPFEGLLGVGDHVVELRGEDGNGVPPTAAPVELNRATQLELRAVKLDAPLRIEPEPAAALVLINGVAVGRGTWEGMLPAGTHRFEARADGYLTSGSERKLEAGSPSVLQLDLVRDEDDERWSIPGKISLELSGGLQLFPSYFGDPASGCDGDCSEGIGLGGLVLAHLAYEFPVGVGLGISGGFFGSSQRIEAREAEIVPVGLSPRTGVVDDETALQGGMVGAHVHLHLDFVVPVLLRLGAGALLGQTRTRRTGRFELDDGFTYQAGPAAQDPFTASLYIAPEARVGYVLAEGFEATLGLSTLILIALERPSWDPQREVDAAVDGIGAFPGENLSGQVWFSVVPSVGARYAF